MWVREVLNERKWRHGDLDTVGIVVRHRGAEGDERVILGHEVRDIGPNGLLVESSAELDNEEDQADGTVFIPYHRVLRITASSGVLWQRQEGAHDQD